MFSPEAEGIIFAPSIVKSPAIVSPYLLTNVPDVFEDTILSAYNVPNGLVGEPMLIVPDGSEAILPPSAIVKSVTNISEPGFLMCKLSA